MFETSERMAFQSRRGAGAHEMNVFCYVAYYPYLNV